jgi:hypothetical protein
MARATARDGKDGRIKGVCQMTDSSAEGQSYVALPFLLASMEFANRVLRCLAFLLRGKLLFHLKSDCIGVHFVLAGGITENRQD